jgi:4-oxalocrotonate tautomerase family enzyme
LFPISLANSALFESKTKQTMPEITIELNEGRSIEQKRALCKGITEVVVETCKVPADRVVITIHETQLVNKAVGGVLFADHLPTA